jgi:quercetin dioxygenase-like cupin family protein
VLEVILKKFENPDETRIFEKGRFDIIKIGDMTIGKASYEPGWKWSKHVSPIANASLCEVEHIGIVLSGKVMVMIKDGAQIELTSGSVFYVPPIPHDSWVIGDEPYISLHFLGADKYTK